MSLGEHDGGLDHLAADLVRRGGDAAFQHVGQLHDDGFDLEGPDAVAGGLDHVVGAADIPEVAVLIPPGHVAGVVHAVVPHRVGGLLVAVVAGEQAAGDLLVGADADLAGLAGLDLVAVGIQQVHVEQRAGLAHGAHLGGGAGEVAQHQRGLRLAEGLHDGQAGVLLEDVEHLGVQRFARGAGVVYAGQIVLRDILADQEAIHGGRRAEGGDVVLLEHRQYVVGVERSKS